VERGLERRDQLLKLVEPQAGAIQELQRAGLEVGKPYTSVSGVQKLHVNRQGEIVG
jgi:hypothetical protein